MWTAEIYEKGFEAGRFFVRVRYKNGPDEFTDTVPLGPGGPDHVRARVKEKVAELEARQSDLGLLTIGPAADPAVPSPTQAELDREAFIANYSKWRRVKAAIDMGVITGNEPQVAALRNKVQADFRPAYLDVI